MPRKVRDVIRDLLQAGFRQASGGKGSHRKFAHPQYTRTVTISGHDNDDAKPYQERQVRSAIEIAHENQ